MQQPSLVEIGHTGCYVDMAESLSHVDATPDPGYPLRILRAHLHNCKAGLWTDNTEGKPPENPLCIALNEVNDKRIAVLEQAIKALEASTRTALKELRGK
ncbi:MAG: hypothetical protein C4542_03020 [Dehalococcoidia bacterium]|nr:MAG: hypothetical protein C4542_03020 [Dehalococcoidia bacterium]